MTEANPMDGKICLVTGGTSGVGLYTALSLVQQGAEVALAGRRLDRAEAAAEMIQARTGKPPKHIFTADLSTLGGARALAEQAQRRLPRLDVLVNNAGGFFLWRSETADGLERTFALNHLSYFLLTNLLLDLLRASPKSRIVNVASDSHRSARILFEDLQLRRGYNPWRAYANSKLANLWFTYELARRLSGSSTTVNGLTPGMVATNLGKQNLLLRPILSVGFALLAKPPLQGAETPVYLASSADVEGLSGRYFRDRQQVASSLQSYDEAAARRMWDLSAELAGVRS